MQIVKSGKRWLAALTLTGAQAASLAFGQYTTYQQPAAMPQAAAPSYAPPVQQSFAAVAPQSYPQAGAQQQQPAYAPPMQPQPQPQAAFAPPPAQSQSVYQVAQRPVAQAAAQPVYNSQQAAAPANVYPQYAPAQGYSPARPAAAANRYAAPAATVAATHAPTQRYPQAAPANSAPYAQPRMAMAFQPQGAASPDDLQHDAQLENITPTADANGAPAPQAVPADAYPGAQQAMPAGAAIGADHNCQPGGYESYPGYGYNGAAAYGAIGPYSTYGYDRPGMMARVLGKHGGGYWFGGVYGLVMDRDSSNSYPLSYAADGMMPDDYPMPSDVVLGTRDVDSGFQGGVEFRLGRTFGGFVADPCGYGCGRGPKWGVEGVYWEIFEAGEHAEYVDTSSVRTYSMMPMRGLEYNGVAVNSYWDYGLPVASPGDYEVVAVHSRSSFEARNLELNLLRLSICGDACAGPAMCNVGCESGQCNTCSTGQCSTGECDAAGYGYGAGRRRWLQGFSCTGVCGVRYLELDESFMYGVDYWNTTTNMPGFLDYWSNTENKLVGFQLGCNGMYRIGCKWGLHMNTLVGLYGNDIDVQQYFRHPAGGMVTYVNGGEFDATASKTDVSMLGELRLGASYQATSHCRVYGGWRALGITGLALAANQTPGAFLDATQMAGYVNSNGSMILHGLQTGVEWNY